MVATDPTARWGRCLQHKREVGVKTLIKTFRQANPLFHNHRRLEVHQKSTMLDISRHRKAELTSSTENGEIRKRLLLNQGRIRFLLGLAPEHPAYTGSPQLTMVQLAFSTLP